jgi:hypothetical protein
MAKALQLFLALRGKRNEKSIKFVVFIYRSVVLRSRLVDIDCFEDRFTVNDRLIDTEVREYLKTTGFCIGTTVELVNNEDTVVFFVGANAQRKG